MDQLGKGSNETVSMRPAISISGRMGLGLLTSVFLVLSFPNSDQGWLAWIALVPLLLACHRLKPFSAFPLGFTSGLAFTLGLFYWMFEVPGFGIHHMLIGGFYFALYPAFWCFGYALLSQRRLLLILTAPALWVALDYVKAHAGFLAFPWATLAHTQHKNLPLLQVATITGEYGVTFLVVMVSLVVAGFGIRRHWQNILAVGVILALIHTWGGYTISHPAPTPFLRVAVIQPSILLNERKTAQGQAASLNRLERLTHAAAAGNPALIAWPETAVRYLPMDPALVGRIQGLAEAVRTNLIIGTSEFVKFQPRGSEGLPEVRSYNSAYFITPGHPPGQPYQKMLLVPFGEYLPLEEVVRWPRWLIPKSFHQVPGEERRFFELSDRTRFVVLICWENLFADFVRPSVQEGAQLLVQLTNDSWFGRTAASRQHNLASVLRAVENRVPMVIASNTGPSQIIDPSGRILASVHGLFVEGIAMAELPLPPRNNDTFYTHNGDLFAWACIAMVLVSMAIGFLRKERPSQKKFLRR